MLSMAIPVAAAAPSYFFAPAGGWYQGLDLAARRDLMAKFHQAMTDPNVTAIVIDVDSPSGSVSGVDGLKPFFDGGYIVAPEFEFIIGANPSLEHVLLRADCERLCKLALPWRGEQTFNIHSRALGAGMTPYAPLLKRSNYELPPMFKRSKSGLSIAAL